MDSKILFLLLGTFVCVESVSIHKRSLTQFGSVIRAVTGRNPLDFNDYGGWCGFGGEGEPKDRIDACCKVHDHCYAGLNRKECYSFTHTRVYTTRYNWYENEGQIYCMNNGECSQPLCECDKAAAECFRDNLDDYDKNKQSFAGGILKHIIPGFDAPKPES